MSSYGDVVLRCPACGKILRGRFCPRCKTENVIEYRSGRWSARIVEQVQETRIDY